MQKIFPNKKLIILTISMVVVLVALGINKMSEKKIGFLYNKEKETEKGKTIEDIISEDSDGDNINNWEEFLWGTDPNNKYTNDGISDLDFIIKKREELQSNTDSNSLEAENYTETDKFAKEFFTTITALNESGNLNDNAIENLSESLSDNIISNTIDDLYKLENIDLNPEATNTDIKSYYENAQKLFAISQFAGIGSELDVLADVDPESEQFSNNLNNISRAYIAFANNLKALKTPSQISLLSLQVINSANKTGVAVKNLKNLVTDPLVGIMGLSQYQKYSEEFINASEDLRLYMVKNDIIDEQYNENIEEDTGDIFNTIFEEQFDGIIE